MSNVLTIDKKTTISIGSLLVFIPAFFYGVTTWARQQAQTEQNTSDITSLITKMDTLNSNLVETNQNVVKLTARIDDFTTQSRSANATTIVQQAAPPQVITMHAQSYQPQQASIQETAQPQPQNGQPDNPPSKQNNQSVITTLASNILGLVGE